MFCWPGRLDTVLSPADTQGPALSTVAWEKGQEVLVQGPGREFRGPALPSASFPTVASGRVPLVPVRASRAPGSGHWSSGHQAPPCFTEQIHFLHQAAALWNKRPYFLQPFLAEADQPWKWLRDLALPRSQQVGGKPGPSLQAPSP